MVREAKVFVVRHVLGGLRCGGELHGGDELLPDNLPAPRNLLERYLLGQDFERGWRTAGLKMDVPDLNPFDPREARFIQHDPIGIPEHLPPVRIRRVYEPLGRGAISLGVRLELPIRHPHATR